MSYNAPGMIAVDEVTRAAVEHAGTPFHAFMDAVLAGRRNTFATRNEDGRSADDVLRGLNPRAVPSMFCSYDSRPGGADRPRIARLWTRDLALSDDVRFSSRSMILHNAKTGSIGSQYEVPSHIVITDTELPDTATTGLVGEHVRSIIAHPALEHPELLITSVEVMADGNTRIFLKCVRVNVGRTGKDRLPIRETGEFPVR